MKKIELLKWSTLLKESFSRNEIKEIIKLVMGKEAQTTPESVEFFKKFNRLRDKIGDERLLELIINDLYVQYYDIFKTLINNYMGIEFQEWTKDEIN